MKEGEAGQEKNPHKPALDICHRGDGAATRSITFYSVNEE